MPFSRTPFWSAGLILALLFITTFPQPACAEGGRTEFAHSFAPSEAWVKPPESTHRESFCLNGSWQFQPVPVPADWKPDQGTPPDLPMPRDDAWEKTPIKIPSAWNVNTWGNGRNVGPGTQHPYWPDSVYYPSYPEHWDGVRMAWMRRTFHAKMPEIPQKSNTYENVADSRYLLHFEAVGGFAEVYVNGKKVGENFGRFLPFECDVTGALRHDGRPNELLVGVRSLRLYDHRHETYTKMRTPYPPGSNMDNLSGIWDDVHLVRVPAVRIDDVFVKPFVSKDTLEVEITVRNDMDWPVRVSVDGCVRRWINKAPVVKTESGRVVSGDVLAAPEPDWELDENTELLFIRSEEITVEPGKTGVLTLSEKVVNRLEHWSMDTPNLYGLVLDLRSPDYLYDSTPKNGTVAGMEDYGGRYFGGGESLVCDTKYTRFGWREFRIVGRELHLNGKPVKLLGDLLHPFGPFINSRRYVWSWYTMVKEMHGNAVRPHAQPHPRIFMELADEMGIAVLDETALFGSSIQLNFAEPVAWDRFAEHYEKLIRRDRNHPSVFGWSWGNELFAIFIYDKNITPEQTDIWYEKLADYGRRGMELDSTRDWFSCDGDEDVRGTMPVWNRHFGHGLPPEGALPLDLDKPLMIGEQGGTYYARPGQLIGFAGDRSYVDYRGRSEALAVDVYQNVTKIALPHLAFFSPAETAWFGLEHLNFGYGDFSRLPTKEDGVFFSKPFEENTPGVQIERLPPYVCTFNPGWDAKLPLFKPLPLFEAQKAAQDPRGPQPWSVDPLWGGGVGNIMSTEFEKVFFLGDTKGELFRRLTAIGVPLETDRDWALDEKSLFVVVDGNTFSGEHAVAIDEAWRSVIVFREASKIPESLEKWLGKSTLAKRTATQLTLDDRFYFTQFLGMPDYYFAEEPGDRNVVKCVLQGDILRLGTVCNRPAAVDWSLFNESPEAAKCAAVCLYEALEKPDGAATVCRANESDFPGEMLFTTIDVIPTSPKNVALWKNLLWGVRFVEPPSRWLLEPARDGKPGAEWAYTVDEPAENWTEPDFDDRAWKKGRGGFGTGVPGVEKSTTPWTGKQIWLRTSFESDEPLDFAELSLNIYHDEDVEVYLNGDLVLKEVGHNVAYEWYALGALPGTTLRKGRNVLAVRCLQTAGGQYIDVGLGLKDMERAAKKEHNLLLDGPVQW